MSLHVERFESVWDAIEDDPGLAEEMKRVSGLMVALIAHIRQQEWSKQEAARQLDASEERIQMLLDGDINAFNEANLQAMCRAGGVAAD